MNRRKDGTTFPCEMAIFPLTNDNGNIFAYAGHQRDITNRKKAAEALKASEERLRLTTSQVPAVLWTTDTDLKFTSSTGAGLGALGLKEEQVVGMTLFEYLQTDDPENLAIKAYRQAVKGNSANYEFEWEGRFFDCHVKPLKNKDDLIIGTIGFALDITERKKAEDELQKAHNELEEHVKERTLELQEKNIALKVLLTQRGEDKNELEQNILSNVKSLIQPYITKLKRNNSNLEDVAYLNIIESNLEDIISPFSQKLSSNYMKFSSKEIEIANLIKDGKKDKEIMEIMNIAFDTVKSHRRNIRKKLGIHGKGINLRNKLLSM
jgi:PAS domain S-box-containing protein